MVVNPVTFKSFRVVIPVTEKSVATPTFILAILKVEIPVAFIFSTSKSPISKRPANNSPPTYKSPPVVVIPPAEARNTETLVPPRPITFNESVIVVNPTIRLLKSAYSPKYPNALTTPTEPSMVTRLFQNLPESLL